MMWIARKLLELLLNLFDEIILERDCIKFRKDGKTVLLVRGDREWLERVKKAIEEILGGS